MDSRRKRIRRLSAWVMYVVVLSVLVPVVGPPDMLGYMPVLSGIVSLQFLLLCTLLYACIYQPKWWENMIDMVTDKVCRRS